MVSYLFFSLPRIDLSEAQVLDLLLAHQVVLHATFQIADLELLATLRHQLVLVKAGIVSNRMLLALVEVIKREGSFVWRCHHCSVASDAVR